MNVEAEAKTTLKVLYLEDSPQDVEIVREMLREAGYHLTLHSTEKKEEFASLLRSHSYDVILSDFRLPGFDAFGALQSANEICPGVPVICVSGSIGEETAIELIRQGAVDYVLKDRLVRLPASIQRTLDEVKEKDARRRAEESLKSSEERLRILFESAPDGIFLMDLDGTFTDLNKASEEIVGYKREELIGKNLFSLDLISKADVQKATDLLSKNATGMAYGPVEFNLCRKDGGRIPAEIRTYRVKIADKTQVLGIARDITERKKADERSHYLAAIVDSSDDAIIGKTLDGVISSWNKGAQEIYGYKEREAVGQSISILLPPDHRDELHAILKTLRAGNHLEHIETVRKRKDGKLIHVSLCISPIHDVGGGVVGAATVARDITERKRGEETRLLLTTALESTANGVVITDLEGNIVWVNKAFTGMTGYTPTEVEGRNLKILKSGIQEVSFYKQLWDTISAGRVWNGELINKKKDGTLYTEEMTITPLKNTKGEVTNFIAVKQDVTERKVAEEKLLRSEEQFRLITENATDLIVVLDLEGRRIYNSPSYKSLLGDPASLRGTDSFREIHPDDREKIRGVFNETVRTGIGKRADFRFLLGDGTVRFIESQGSVIRDPQGNVSQVVVVSRDVTEERKLEAQYLRGQRMESLGTLAGGIAHDLNNVLAPILLSTDILKKKFPDAESLKLLTILESSALRGKDIIKQVLTFARGVEGERAFVQVRHLISEMEKIMKETFPKSIECICDAPKSLWPLRADVTQIHQVMMNLCVNARDAMPNGGKLRLSAENVVIDKQYAGMNIDAEVGQYVVIKVQDTGHGIPEEYLEKIFEPFFTTKEVGKGTGLGLATAHSIVRSHGGFLNVYSESGKGTEFKVYLPAVEGAGAGAKEEEKDSLPSGDGEVILVVDDESSILEITRETLETFGYKVLVARDGTEAVALYAENRDKISVVLTDLMMPIMDGASTIRVLQNMNPAVKIIAASGMSSGGSDVKNVGSGVQGFLYKPYRAEALLKTLKEVLKKG